MTLCNFNKDFEALNFYTLKSLKFNKLTKVNAHILQNWFHVKSTWQKNPEIPTLCIGNFHIVLRLTYSFTRPFSTITKSIFGNIIEVSNPTSLLQRNCQRLRLSNGFIFFAKFQNSLMELRSHLFITRTNTWFGFEVGVLFGPTFHVIPTIWKYKFRLPWIFSNELFFAFNFH